MAQQLRTLTTLAEESSQHSSWVTHNDLELYSGGLDASRNTALLCTNPLKDTYAHTIN